jgi:hypothetical protein
LQEQLSCAAQPAARSFALAPSQAKQQPADARISDDSPLNIDLFHRLPASGTNLSFVPPV